ncbi:hypothetical protein GCM10009111_06990 [Colwellia asteriadis]|uniref:Glutathione S-transferase n=1 Tax=Colwellia asteriadis TaxID=517723 RepID=A0ABP3WCY9_9GAMM
MTTKQVHIYGASFSNFVRSVMLVCEEKNITYTTGFEVNSITVPFHSEQHFALHPFGKFPVLVENDFILPETASICRYLDSDKALQPHDSKTRARHDAFCAHLSIDIDKALIRDYLIEFAFPKGENGEVRLDVAKQAIPAATNALKVIELQLTTRDIIGGKNLSIADALLAPMLAYLSSVPSGFNLLEDFPNLTEYLARLMTHDSCQKVLTANPDKSIAKI